MDNIIVNKNDFIEHIRQWVVLDSQTKIIHEKTKAIRERKNDLNAKICNYAKQHNMKQKITITDGQLR